MTGNQPSGAETTHRRREIAAHFEGRGSKKADALMRAHLQTCASCVRHYERHMLLGLIDPRAPSALERIGRSLGFSVEDLAPAPLALAERPRSARPRIAWMTLAAAGVTTLVLLMGRAGLHRPTNPALEPADGFLARGANRPGESIQQPRFWTYRIPSAGVPALVDRTFAASDELAFSYSNSPGLPYLMLFGVDEHRHVYWFHPGWPSGAPAPKAIRAADGPGPHELSEAIRHHLDGRTLTIYAVSSPRVLGAPFIEETVRRAPDLDVPDLFGPEARWSRRPYEVTP